MKGMQLRERENNRVIKKNLVGSRETPMFGLNRDKKNEDKFDYREKDEVNLMK